MRLGVMPSVLAGPVPTIEEMVNGAVRAEQEGLDSYWYYQRPVQGWDGLTVLALAGNSTKRISLGIGVIPTYPRHPVVMAQQALTIQAAIAGRLFLGIGPSRREWMEGLGYDFQEPVRHMREYLAVLKSLSRQDVVEAGSGMVRLKTDLEVPNMSPFPVLVGAMSPLMLRVAGELADGTVTWMAGPRGLESDIIPRIVSAAESSGRPRPYIAVMLPLALVEDWAVGEEAAGTIFASYQQMPSYRRLIDIEGAAHPGAVCVVGNEVELERRLNAFAEAGADEFIASVIDLGIPAQASVQQTVEFLASLCGRLE